MCITDLSLLNLASPSEELYALMKSKHCLVGHSLVRGGNKTKVECVHLVLLKQPGQGEGVIIDLDKLIWSIVRRH